MHTQAVYCLPYIETFVEKVFADRHKNSIHEGFLSQLSRYTVFMYTLTEHTTQILYTLVCCEYNGDSNLKSNSKRERERVRERERDERGREREREREKEREGVYTDRAHNNTNTVYISLL